MTKEQAVVYLRFSGFSDEQIKAIEGAFTCDKCVYSTNEGCQYDDITETIPPFETSDYCVSRQAVEEMIKAEMPERGMWEIEGDKEKETVCEVCVDLIQKLSQLPPVTPQLKTGWIPVSEDLPKPFSYVNCTCRSLIDDREDWVIETCYVPQPKNSPYSDWGNIPMLNHGECEVIAWMYRNIPKPYRAESEGE